jgi:hypothetical protein
LSNLAVSTGLTRYTDYNSEFVYDTLKEKESGISGKCGYILVISKMYLLSISLH